MKKSKYLFVLLIPLLLGCKGNQNSHSSTPSSTKTSSSSDISGDTNPSVDYSSDTVDPTSEYQGDYPDVFSRAVDKSFNTKNFTAELSAYSLDNNDEVVDDPIVYTLKRNGNKVSLNFEGATFSYKYKQSFFGIETENEYFAESAYVLYHDNAPTQIILVVHGYSTVKGVKNDLGSEAYMTTRSDLANRIAPFNVDDITLNTLFNLNHKRESVSEKFIEKASKFREDNETFSSESQIIFNYDYSNSPFKEAFMDVDPNSLMIPMSDVSFNVSKDEFVTDISFFDGAIVMKEAKPLEGKYSFSRDTINAYYEATMYDYGETLVPFPVSVKNMDSYFEGIEPEDIYSLDDLIAALLS